MPYVFFYSRGGRGASKKNTQLLHFIKIIKSADDDNAVSFVWSRNEFLSFLNSRHDSIKFTVNMHLSVN